MSEAASEPVAEAPQTDPAAPEAPAAEGVQPDSQPEPDKGDGKDLATELAKWKALARKHEGTSRANSAAAQRLAEIEESQKTEQQRLADRLATAERERDDARQGHARLMAAATHSIPATLIDRIVGSTDEEINESAETLAAEIERLVAARLTATAPPAAPAPAPAVPASTRPVESLTAGAQPANQPTQDPDAWLRDMSRRGG